MSKISVLVVGITLATLGVVTSSEAEEEGYKVEDAVQHELIFPHPLGMDLSVEQVNELKEPEIKRVNKQIAEIKAEEERLRKEEEAKKIAQAKAEEEAKRKAEEEVKAAAQAKAEAEAEAEAKRVAEAEAKRVAEAEAEAEAQAMAEAEAEAQAKAEEEAEAKRVAEAEAEAEAKRVAEAEAEAMAEAEAEAEAQAMAEEEAKAVAQAEKEKQEQEAEKQVSTSTTSQGNQPATSYLLAQLVESEATGEPYVGKVAVAEVVLNRVNDGGFPNSIEGVIYQPGQFQVVSNGRINMTPSQESINASNEALAGSNYTYGALYFFNASTATNRWQDSLRTTTVIGSHTFNAKN